MSEPNNTKNPKSKGLLTPIAVSLIVVIGFIVAIIAYTGAQTAQLETLAENSARKTAELVASEITATVEYGTSSIKSAANSISASMTSDTLDDPSAVIEPLLQNTPFDAIEYIRADGMNVMNVGSPFDASTRTYYIEGIKGNTGIWNNYHPKTTQDVLMNFYTPLIRNGKIVGVITGYIQGNATMAPSMESDFYGQKTYELLYDSDGMVIAHTDSSDFQVDLTLDAYLEQFSATESQKSQLLAVLTAGEEGVTRYEGPDGEGLVCIAKVANTDWTTAMFIPASSLSAVMNASRWQTTALVVVVLLLALFCIGYIGIRSRRKRLVLSDENALLDQVVSTLSADYQNVFIIDAGTGVSRPIFMEEGVQSRIGVAKGVAHSYEETCARYIASRFHPDDASAMRANMDLANVVEQLKDKAEYTGSFRIVDNGTIHHYQFKYRSVPGTSSIILGFLNIDALVAGEVQRAEELQRLNDEQESHLEEVRALNSELEERQAQLEEATAEQEAQIEEVTALNLELDSARESVSEAYGMIEGLSQEYHTIWVVSKETSRMRLVRSSGKSTIQGAVQMGIDMPEFDSGFDAYIDTYVEPEDRERMHRQIAFAEVLRQLEEHPDATYAVNYLRRTDDGAVGYHQIAFANADTKDGHRRFVYGFRDVDAIVREEQARVKELTKAKSAAESANDAKTSFLFSMSHDIRTPMNAIIGFTNLLEKYQDDPTRRRDYLAKIKDSSTVLLSIINNVLEMARIESGAVELNEEVCSVGSISASLDQSFGVLMAEKGIDFSYSIDVVHPYIYNDTVKSREILDNLLSNALKYTNPGGKVEFKLQELGEVRPGVVMFRNVVSDTGIGMSEDFLPHLFEEFSREHTTTETKVEGTGLGMPIVKRLVDLMGGTIQVQSRLGEGTTFMVDLPHRIADSAVQDVEAAAEISYDAFRGKRLLLAEDNDLNAEIACEILGESGFIIDRAENGAICVDLLSKAPADCYDAILMDVQMPVMNGYQATRAIRALDDPAKAGIPILAMTANAFEEDKRAALAAGMDGHIAKPIDIGELMSALASVLA